jgi:hypothetical protein
MVARIDRTPVPTARQAAINGVSIQCDAFT